MTSPLHRQEPGCAGPLVDTLSGQPADGDVLRLPAYGALWLVTGG